MNLKGLWLKAMLSIAFRRHQRLYKGRAKDWGLPCWLEGSATLKQVKLASNLALRLRGPGKKITVPPASVLMAAWFWPFHFYAWPCGSMCSLKGKALKWWLQLRQKGQPCPTWSQCSTLLIWWARTHFVFVILMWRWHTWWDKVCPRFGVLAC